MRYVVSVAGLCLSLVLVQPKPGLAQAAQRLAQTAPALAAKPPSPRETYAAMTLNERVAIQSDLVWTGHYDGIIDGDFGKRSLAAVNAFQKSLNHAETGILNPHEREQLASRARARQADVGWRRVDDSATGVGMGLPTKLVPQEARVPNGTRWASKGGDVLIETFRVSGPAVTLESVATQLRAVSGRKVDYDVQRPGFFVMTGSQGSKKFYIRAHAQDHDVRGFTILYEAAKDATIQPLTVAISNAFAPFSGQGTIQVSGRVARPKVEYTTGLIASAAGHILADKEATEGCKVITVPQVGPAERAAADPASGLALLRAYGASDLRPAALAGGAGNGNAVTLVGVADPRAQDGGGAVGTPSVRLSGKDDARAFAPAPPAGFSGAAVVDRRGRFYGTVLFKTQVGASPGTADSKAMLVPAETVRTFLHAQGVTPASGSAAVKEIKPAVVRVICVRS